MSQPLHPRRPGVALNLLHPWNSAERQAQADRVLAREAKQHASQIAQKAVVTGGHSGRKAGH
jgi:hypothetical protein